MANGIVQKGGKLPCPVDASGAFTDQVSDFQGQHVKVPKWGCGPSVRAWFRCLSQFYKHPVAEGHHPNTIHSHNTIQFFIVIIDSEFNLIICLLHANVSTRPSCSKQKILISANSGYEHIFVHTNVEFRILVVRIITVDLSCVVALMVYPLPIPLP